VIEGGVSKFAKGGVFGGKVTAYATGGVVDKPTFFPMKGNQTGVMGEAGPDY
jgi:phage-related minor tail protein